MAADSSGNKPSYRLHAFTHWLNLAFLAGAGVAGVVIDPVIWMVAAPLEMGAMWVLPDLPNFRARVDQQQAARDLIRERAYYLQQLWGLAPRRLSRAEWIIGLFADFERDDLDARVLKKDPAFQQYAEMRQIISELTDLEKVRGEPIVSNEINRLEQVINGYLRYLMGCKSLDAALRGVDSTRLKKELVDLEAQVKNATPDLRSVLFERKRLCETQLEKIPKLQATLELFRTRAEAIVYQLRNLKGQVLADPGVNVNAFLEDLVEKHEIMADPLSELEADQAVREILHSSDADSRRRTILAAQSGKGIRQG